MPGWSTKLIRPVAIKSGPILRTLSDARTFIIDHLPEEVTAKEASPHFSATRNVGSEPLGENSAPRGIDGRV